MKLLTSFRKALAISAISVILGSFASVGPSSAQQRQILDTPDVNVDAEALATDLGSPGIAVGVVAPNGQVKLGFSGVAANGNPITAETVFVWGSVSKSIAAVTAAILSEQGELDLGAAVADIVPTLRGTAVDQRNITVEQLIHHTSGLPHDLSLTDDWDRRGGALENMGFLAEVDDFGPVGKYRYSSINYLLLQAIIEKTTGHSYGEVLEEVTAAQTGVHGIVADRNDFIDEELSGHVPFFGFPKEIEVGVDAAGFGYGYLAGNIEQLTAFTMWLLKDLRSAENSSLTRQVGLVTSGENTSYGAGLFHERRQVRGSVREIVRHSGAVPGFYSSIVIDPKGNQAVIVLSNSYGELWSPSIANTAAAFSESQLGFVDEARTTSRLVPLELVAAVVIALLLGCVQVWYLRSSVRNFRLGKLPSHPAPKVVAAVAVASGTMVVFSAAIPAVVGAPVAKITPWAPDIALLLYLILAQVCILASGIILANLPRSEK